MWLIFFCDFILQTRAFAITFGSLPGDGDTPNTIFWESNPQNGTNIGTVQAPYQLYNVGGVPWGTPNSCNAFSPTILAARLRLMNQVNFTIQSVGSLDANGGTSEFRSDGEWLKAFHQNPAKKMLM